MRIALISDIHFGALSTTSELAIIGEKLKNGEVQNAVPLFQGLIDLLKNEKPDYLFIAGDLTSSGSPLEFKYCYNKIRHLVNTVGIEPSHIAISLGNHDIDWRISTLADLYTPEPEVSDDRDYLRESYRKLAYTWSTQMDNNEINILPNFVKKHSIPLTGVIDYDDCVVFVLNSGHLCTRDKNTEHGCLSKSQFDWFDEIAQQYKNSKKLKIVLLHHHPFNYPFPIAALDLSTLAEGSELSLLCGKAGVDLVLHGHRHHPQAKTVSESGWIKPVTYICSGSLSVNASDRLGGYIPNTFHIIDIEKFDKIILSNYLYNPTTGWSLIEEENKYTPVEGKKWLGKIIDEQSAIKLIEELPINTRIEYQSLKDDLMYISISKLNELVQRVFSNNFEIYDEFPNAIMIFKPAEG